MSLDDHENSPNAALMDKLKYHQELVELEKKVSSSNQ